MEQGDDTGSGVRPPPRRSGGLVEAGSMGALLVLDGPAAAMMRRYALGVRCYTLRQRASWWWIDESGLTTIRDTA